MSGTVDAILGWLLDQLSPGLTRRIRNKYVVAEVTAVVTSEIVECGLTMALLASRVRGYQGTVDNDFAAWLSEYVRDHQGIDKDQPGLVLLRDPRNVLLGATSERQRSRDHGLSMKTYSLPVLDAHMHDLSICKSDWRAQVLQFRASLELLGADANEANSQNERTFDSGITEPTLATMLLNASRAYERVRVRAEDLARLAVAIRDLTRP